MPRGRTAVPYSYGMLLLLLLGVMELVPAEPGKWGKSAVFVKGQWTPFDENDEAGVPQPYPPRTDSWMQNDTSIMVSISSFRDYRCPKTLYNLFTKATNPNRVFAGVVQQNSHDDADCLYGYCEMIKEERGLEPKTPATGPAAKVLENCPHADQVRMLRVSSEDAKGPTYGRYLGSKLLGSEEFCMQIDAHMDFEDEWDKQLLDMWGLTNNEYGVLTTYVPNFDQLHLNLNNRYEVPQICKVLYTKPENMVRNEQATNCIWLSKPKLTASWAAGFSFNKCHADLKAPYDPHLPSLFDGEEYSKYARMWTRGYDTYTPHRSIVYHDYTHGPQTKRANAWSRKHRELKRSHDRLRTLLGDPDAHIKRDTPEAKEMLGRWDLGEKRSLNQLIAFTGVDTRNSKIDFDNCGKLQWVPFEEGEDDDWYVEDRREAQAKAKRISDKTRALAGIRGERVSDKKGRGSKGSITGGQARHGAGGVHGLDERLAIPEGGGAVFILAICLIAFAAVVCACIYTGRVLRFPEGKLEKGGWEGGRAWEGVDAGLLADFGGLGSKVVKMI